jgi:hypothetical protein
MSNGLTSLLKNKQKRFWIYLTKCTGMPKSDQNLKNKTKDIQKKTKIKSKKNKKMK